MKETFVPDENFNKILKTTEYRKRCEFYKMKVFLKLACEYYYGLKCVPFHHKECFENILEYLSDMMDILESNKVLMTKFLKFLSIKSRALNSTLVVRANTLGIAYRMDTMYTIEINRSI